MDEPMMQGQDDDTGELSPWKRTALRPPPRTPLRSTGSYARTPLRKPTPGEMPTWHPLSWGGDYSYDQGGYEQQMPGGEPEPEFECEDIGMKPTGDANIMHSGMPYAAFYDEMSGGLDFSMGYDFPDT